MDSFSKDSLFFRLTYPVDVDPDELKVSTISTHPYNVYLTSNLTHEKKISSSINRRHLSSFQILISAYE